MTSLGEKLRQAREARGVTLGEVAEQTRISTHYLEAIESNDYRNLPGGIFNKGFVKAYAKYVGIDEQEALQDYSKIISEQGDKLSEPELRVNRPEVLTDDSVGRTSMLPTVIFAAVILGLMTWGILALINFLQENQDKQQQAANVTAKQTPSALVNAAPQAINTTAVNSNTTTSNSNTITGNTNTTTQPEATTDAPGEIAVQLKSTSTEVEKPNVTTTQDGKWESYTFVADEPRTYSPQQYLRVRYSKWQAKNVQMTINGKAITLPEKPMNPKDQGIAFEINKTNIAQILQAGAITTESISASSPNANTSNTTTPANTATKQ